MRFIFTLGFSEDLALLELNWVTGQTAQKVADHQYSLELPSLSRLNYIAGRLGGLVEVADETGKVVWRHSAKSWFKRDRGKPYASGRKGMLPPKIARILINFAVQSDEPAGKTLLDPFCGTGTILLEAGTIGLTLIGNDLDPKQIAGTSENLRFFGFTAKTYNLDSVKLSSAINSVDYIVTEPFMGRPNVQPDRLSDLSHGLQKLYLGCLKDWAKFLKTGGRLVMIFPIFTYEDKKLATSQVVDDPHLLDYNIHTRGLVYSKPEAQVKREIVILEKK